MERLGTPYEHITRIYIQCATLSTISVFGASTCTRAHTRVHRQRRVGYDVWGMERLKIYRRRPSARGNQQQALA
jgi:hypothetical protein